MGIKENNDKISSFRNNDEVCIFSDSKILYKLAGENVWYLLDYDGNTLVRTKPDGTEEFSTVDFYDMEGEPFAVEFGQLLHGLFVIKFVCEKDGYQIEQFYEISPSGFTYKPHNDSDYQRFGIDYRFNKNYSVIDFLRRHVSGFKSKERLDLLYDVAKSKLMDDYDKFMKTKSRGPYKMRESIYLTNARKLTKRYFEVLEYIKKQQIKKETKLQNQPHLTEPS